MEAVFNWLHVVAVVIWIGGLSFMLFALMPPKSAEGGTDAASPSVFLNAAHRFRPWLWGSMAVITGSGVYKIVQAGGMKHLPTVVHIKLLLALIMIALSLYNSMVVLPKVMAHGSGSLAPEAGLYRTYVWSSIIVLVLALVIFALLSYAHLI